MRFIALLLVCWLMIGSGSVQARRNRTQVDAEIDIPCLTGPVRMIDCDPSQGEPLHCKFMAASYLRGCEKLVVRK